VTVTEHVSFGKRGGEGSGLGTFSKTAGGKGLVGASPTQKNSLECALAQTS